MPEIARPAGARPGGWRHWPARLALLAAAAVLAACGTRPVREAAPVAPPPPPPVPPAAQAPPPPPAAAPVPVPRVQASAGTPREYRRYGASHIYAQHPERIYPGMLPPLLHAVGVLNVDIDAMGEVRRLDWMRAPRHAPEVMAEIERLVRAAAPYPAPVRMGGVTWTDVWLWDKSGRFQLDTLTEGQSGRLPAAAPPRAATPKKRKPRDRAR